MCMFGGRSLVIKHVSRTRIYAKGRSDGRQVLVYRMTIEASEPVAMILPIPVAAGSGDDAIRFIDLRGYREFFTDLDRAFPPEEVALSVSRGGLGSRAVVRRPRLKVHPVGDFEASFVPTLGDFDRLDPRFRLDDAVWDALPHHHDYGFAVFQLTDVARRGGLLRLRRRKDIQPMAFEFPSRDPSQLFFPTVHVHDGQVHERAEFDHQLYAQVDDGEPEHDLALGWQVNAEPLRAHVDASRARDLIDVGTPCYKRTLEGQFPNQDTWVRVRPADEAS